MNCKQGDLAVIVRGENVSRIVEIIRLVGVVAWLEDFGPFWKVLSAGTELVTHGGLSTEAIFPDAWLRPIRPGELDDETQDNRELESV